MNKSIYDLVQYNLSQGWLVQFTELYNLIETLTKHNWIINPEIKAYFENLNPNQYALSRDQLISSKPENNDRVNRDELLNLPFFRSLDTTLSEKLFKDAKLYKLKPSVCICNAGDSTRDLFVLISGQVGIYKNVGSIKQLVAVLNDSSVFGEAGFLLGQKRSADIITLKESLVLVIPYNAATIEPVINTEKATQLQFRFWVQHALLHSDLFRIIPSDCLDALTSTGRIVEIKKDKILFKQGDKSEAAYIIIQGELSIVKDQKAIRTLKQGDALGEIALMATGGVRTATAQSTKDTLLLEIPRDQFYRLLSSNLVLAKELEQLAHQRLQADHNRPK
jgi:CRP-like cAMP-binding protein